MPYLFKLAKRCARLRAVALTLTALSLACEPGADSISDPVVATPSISTATIAAVPGTVGDLAITGVTDTSVTLTFTQVDDGLGAPATYDMRYAAGTINWGSAASVGRGTCATPVAGTAIGTKLSCTVLGLSRATGYAFQLVEFRGTLNGGTAVFGGLSNVATGATASGPPGTVTNLAVTGATDTSVTLTFTQVDDGSGKPAMYDVRWASGTINWGGASSVSRGTCATTLVGTAINTILSCTVLGLSSTRAYAFELVAFRGTFNTNSTVFGGLSNVASGSTTAPTKVPVASVTVSPSSASGSVGQSAQFAATLRDASGNVLTGRTVTWSSTNSGVVTVTSTGYVTAMGAGSAAVVATAEGTTGQAPMTVSSAAAPAPVATVTVSPGSASVGVGGTQQYTATLKDASGNVLTGRTVTWASSALGVATITGSGLASALVAGTATITATSEGKNGTGGLTVTALPPPPPSGTWPHEPSGWTVISDWGFDVAPPASSADLPIVGSPGWSVIYNGGAGPAGSNVALVSVAGAPLSPPAVYQFTYKQGFPAGVGPANVYHPVSTSRIYVGFWWRMSNPWTTTTAAQKLLYLMDGASNIVFDMQGNTGTASDPFWTRWVIDGTEYRGDVTYNLTPGVWYRIELVADLNAKTMQWWIYNPQSDAAPVLVGNKSGVAYATGTINQVQVAPTYGGLGTPAVQDQYFQYDHIHISGH